MSLIADLVDLYDSTVYAAAPTVPEPTPTRVPYTAPGGGGAVWSGGQSTTSQLQLTTAESTLFSVLELIAKTTSRVKWDATRRTKDQKPGQEPQIIPPEQNPAVALWNRPNNFMTGRFVRHMLTWHYRAVGEAWMVCDYWDAGRTLMKSWWPVRPDRMAPVPDPDDFLVGYTYTGPSGEKVPLDPSEVMRITNPHPLDPHRGMGVVQTLGTIIGTSMESAQWIANFFHNDATPGGIIEIPEGLGDTEYKRLVRRWNEQHKGTSKAHRVAILEWGTFKPRSYSMKDMQFPEIRQLSRDQILEALRIHKHNMGISDDVNRANAVAAREQLAENETKPNLDEWHELANGQFLERCGAAGTVVQFDYQDPTPEDKEDNRADDAAMVDNYVKLLGARVDPVAAAEFLGMPPLPLVVEAAPEPDTADPEPAEPAVPSTGELDETKKGDPSAVAVTAQKLYLAVKDNALLTRVEGRAILKEAGADIDPDAWDEDEDVASPEPIPAGPVAPDPAPAPSGVPAAPPPPVDEGAAGGDPEATVKGRASMRGRRPRGEVDLARMSDDWQEALDALLAKWPGILDDQYSALAQQVRDAVDAGDLEALLALTAPDVGAADRLTTAMAAVALTGAHAVQREADDQGVDIGVRTPDRAELAAQASVVTGLMRMGLALAAGQAALRVLSPASTGAEVAASVREHLDSLTDAQPRQHLGGAITAAQNSGRFETMAHAPAATYVASEQLDGNTCTPCGKVDGRKYDTLELAKEDYPTSGFKNCQGMERCRGTIVAVWEIEDGGDGE